MKKLFTMSILVNCFMFATGQIGINTLTPQTVFHVDGSGDTPATSPGAIQPDDFVVTSSGNVGIGTISPSVKLEIQSPTSPAVKIVDGTQAAGKVLTSDANGNAHWKVTTLYRVAGRLGSGVGIPLDTQTTTFAQTNSSITLTPGKWDVFVTMLLNVERGTNTLTDARWVWLGTSFANTNAGPVGLSGLSSDIEGNNIIYGSWYGPLRSPAIQKYSMLNGHLIINNTSASSKTYYFVAGYLSNDGEGTGFGTTFFRAFGTALAGENSIVATPIQ